MGRIGLTIVLCLCAPQVLASVLLVDLSEPDPAGLDDLPGITDEEARLLREASGPSPEDLGRRLASTRLGTDRLVEWAPYLTVGPTDTSWDVDAVAGGEADVVGTVRQRIRIATNGCRLEAAWKRTARSPLGQEHAWITCPGRMRSEISAGAISGLWTGPAPWEDPVARGRLVSGDDSDCVPVGRAGARGLSVRAPRLHLMGWTDRDDGRGWMGRLGGTRHWIWAAMSPGRGSGGGLGFALASAGVTFATHFPQDRGRFLRIGVHARAGSTALVLAVPIDGDRGSGLARIDARSRIGAGPFTVRAEGGCTQGAGRIPVRRNGTIAIARSAPFSRVTLTGAWTGDGGRLSCRMERQFAAWTAKGSVGCPWRHGGGAVDARLGLLRPAGRVRAESTIAARDHGWEAALTASTIGTGARARVSFRIPLTSRPRSPRWEIAVGERGG
jgi:hypothetical protein